MELNGSVDVDVWLLPISRLTEEERELHKSLLSIEEREKAARFVSSPARDQFTAARALLRTALSKYTELSTEVWVWSSNDYGRPLVALPEEFRNTKFSVSHTNGLVVCAICGSREVGVDAEYHLPHLDFLGLSRSFFSYPEAQHLRRLEGHHLRSAFYAYWTLKESYVKARGIGLSLPLDSFWFEIGHDSPRLFCGDRCNDDPSRWRFFRWGPTDDHSVALAVEAAEDMSLNLNVRWVMNVRDVMRV